MDGAEPLFRSQAVEAARRRIGEPVQPLGVASWAVTIFMTVLLVCVAGFLCLAKFARMESVSGSLEPMSGAARVASPRAAVVTGVHVQEGQAVQAGDALFTLASDPVMEGGGRLGGVLRGVSESQKKALASQIQASQTAYSRQRDELSARVGGQRQRILRLRDELELQRERLSLNQASLASYETLRAQGFVSEVRYRAQAAAVLDDRRAVSALERDIDSSEANLTEAQASLSRIAAEAGQAQAALEGSRADLDEREATAAAQTAVVVTAPKAGRVTLQAREGSSVPTGAALAIILPPGTRLKAQLWAPSRAAGFIREGDKVRLLYDAFPYQRFGAASGHVLSVASAPTAPQDIPITLETREALYRVDVALDAQTVNAYGRKWPLAAGSRTTGDIILESRSLLSWVLDPLLAIKNRRM